MSTFSTSLQEAVVPGTAEYEPLRTRYFHARVPNTKPARIYMPRTTLDVSEIIKQAHSNNWKVGVRSGGHLFPCCSLVQDGILIDTCYLNQGIEYDRQTQLVSFPPGARSKELAEALTAVGRFFPFGHAPTVAVGGFLLAGGQGWFMRGWGCTSDTWVVRMEIVTPDGRIVQASKTENEDLFWAARGSGQGFFGVVTRIWGRTIPMRRLWETAIVFDCTQSESFNEILHALFEVSDRTPKHGIEIAFATFRPDREEPGLGDEVQDERVFIVANSIAFADTLAEAETLLSPWGDLPKSLKKYIVATVPVAARTWDDIWEAQDKLTPTGNGERWQCDSILDRPGVAREELIQAIKPAMCDLPTRRSIGCIYIGDYVPDENDQAISLPQHYYIASMTCWTDPSWDGRMSRWMLEKYTQAATVSCGQYVADFDVNQRMTPVLSDTALQKFLAIRQKWDLEEMFVGYRGFSGLVAVPPSL